LTPLARPRGLLGVVLVNLLVDGRKVAAPELIRWILRVVARRRCGGLGSRAFLLHQGRGDAKVGYGALGVRSACWRHAMAAPSLAWAVKRR
jgi:hypothetical protein